MTAHRAVALVRVSTETQDVDRQVKAAEAWAAQTGHRMEVVREEGVSGCAKVRPGLDAVMAACRSEKKRPAALWVSELSRIGRSLSQVVGILAELDSLGVRVVVAGAGIDYGSPAGRFQAQIIAAVAEFEREMIRERTRDGLRAARKRGSRLGRPPDRWDDDALALLRAGLASGKSPHEIHSAGALRVWRSRWDEKAEDWTEERVSPGRSAVYVKAKEVRT